MKARRMISMLLVSVVAAAGPVHAEPELPAYVADARFFGAYVDGAATYGDVFGVVAADGTGYVCATIFSTNTERFDSGCDDVTLAIDPALRTVRGTVVIPSRVWESWRWDHRGMRSSITVTVNLDEAGDLQPFASHSGGAGPGWASEFIDVSVWRPAAGPVRLVSRRLCDGIRGACSEIAGALTDSAAMATMVSAAVFTPGSDDGECGMDTMGSIMRQRLGHRANSC